MKESYSYGWVIAIGVSALFGGGMAIREGLVNYSGNETIWVIIIGLIAVMLGIILVILGLLSRKKYTHLP